MSAPLLSLSSSEDEEISPRPPSKVRKKHFKQCYMHLTSIKKEEIKDFTRTRWDTQKLRQTVAWSARWESNNYRNIQTLSRNRVWQCSRRRWVSLYLLQAFHW